MATLKLQRVPCLTIYNAKSELEAMARNYPEAADKFVTQNPKLIESWTMLDHRIAPRFLELQAGWLAKGGELWITDMHRKVLGPYGQVETFKKKPHLAKKPGWSMHIGFAFDYVMELLGPDKTTDEFIAYAAGYGWAAKETWHLQCLPKPWDSSKGDNFLELLAAGDMPLTTEGIRMRLQALGYDAETSMTIATTQFQQDFGLTVDGIPGHNTQLSLVLGTIKTEVIP